MGGAKHKAAAATAAAATAASAAAAAAAATAADIGDDSGTARATARGVAPRQQLWPKGEAPHRSDEGASAAEPSFGAAHGFQSRDAGFLPIGGASIVPIDSADLLQVDGQQQHIKQGSDQPSQRAQGDERRRDGRRPIGTQ